MLEKEIKQIKSWSQDKKIPIFEADKDLEIKKIDWKSIQDDDSDTVLDFLNFLQIIKPDFVILEYDTFDYALVQDDFKSTCKDLRDSDYLDVLSRFKELNKILKSKQGEIFYYELSYVSQGFMFSFSNYTIWSEDYSEFSEIIKDYKDIDYLIDRYIINDETIELAKELAQYELFNKATNKPQRELAASLFFKNRKLNKKILYNISSIIDYADSIKKMEI